jgi:CheY-like chemotaxis protein
VATRCNPGFPDRKAYPFPALLLLDLKMHGIAGFGVLRWLQGQPELRKKLIVVVISVTQSSEEIRCGLRTGGAFVMSKIQKQICRHRAARLRRPDHKSHRQGSMDQELNRAPNRTSFHGS